MVLLPEEMRRVKEYLVWHANWWEGECSHWCDQSPADEEGMNQKVYATRQASLRCSLDFFIVANGPFSAVHGW